MREKLLVSACLLGENCRVQRREQLLPNAAAALGERYELIPVCRSSGGTAHPRAPRSGPGSG